MKKIIIYSLMATTLLHFSTQAQKKKTTFAILTGVNFNKIVGKDYDGDKIADQELNFGYHPGFNVDIPVFSNFSLQAGLQFTAKGSKRNGEDFFGKYTGSIKTYYVEMPVKIVFKPQVGKGNLLLGIGPDVAYGIAGNWKFDYAGGSQNDESGKIKFKNTRPSNPNPDEDFLKPIDVSISILIGYQFANNLFLNMDGQLGLTKINPKDSPVDPDDKTNWKNVGFGFTVGYRFGGK